MIPSLREKRQNVQNDGFKMVKKGPWKMSHICALKKVPLHLIHPISPMNTSIAGSVYIKKGIFSIKKWHQNDSNFSLIYPLTRADICIVSFVWMQNVSTLPVPRPSTHPPMPSILSILPFWKTHYLLVSAWPVPTNLACKCSSCVLIFWTAVDMAKGIEVKRKKDRS